MQTAPGLRSLSLSLLALLLAAATLTTSAVFHADKPGSTLSPVDDANEIIQLLEGSKTVLWTALSGSVVSYRAEGWPLTIDGNELGGALMIERPEDGFAGVVDFGEKPRSLSFELGPYEPEH